VRVNVFVAVSCVGVVESETPTAKVKLPAAVGVPDNTPALGDNAMPFGGEPLPLTTHNQALPFGVLVCYQF
jgi:hypothetical protein